VLISSHENALRGILMHLCDIPEEAMTQLHIPNGVPLVYNVKAKCISLLEDKESNEQISIEDFGPAAKYLFQPCDLDEEFFESNVEQIEASLDEVHVPVMKDYISDFLSSVNIEKENETVFGKSFSLPTNVSSTRQMSP
jgi:hypothetical protein